MMDRRDSPSEILTTLVFCEVIGELGAPASQKSAATSVCEEQECASAYFYANCMQKRKKKTKLCPGTSEAICLPWVSLRL